MLKTTKLPIFFTIVIMFFLIYGLAMAADQPPSHQSVSQQPANKRSLNTQGPVNLEFFKTHLKEGLTQQDVIALFGENYMESLSDQSGEPAWTYDFPVDPSYKTKVPPYAVDEEGLLKNKLRYQLSIIWEQDQIKSYIVFYNNKGTIDELKEKFFDGPYPNE